MVQNELLRKTTLFQFLKQLVTFIFHIRVFTIQLKLYFQSSRPESREESIMEVKISSDSFGTVMNPRTKKREEVVRYSMRSSQIIVQVVSYGATVTSIETPDKEGKLDDVVLGFDDIHGKY